VSVRQNLRRIIPVLLLVGSVVLAPRAAAEFPPGTSAADLPSAVAWGENSSGQIGDGTTGLHKTPVLSNAGGALTGKEVSAVSAGDSSTCAIAEGSLYCWGKNTVGQLGLGSTGPSILIPTKVGGPFTNKVVTAVSVGFDFACAVADFDAYCWGNNADGQLGDNTDVSKPSPTPVYNQSALAGKKVSAISAGKGHTCAVANGKAFCWGQNDDGEAGNINVGQDDQKVPVAVSTTGLLNGLTVDSVAVGFDHSCVMAAGRAYCWGANAQGQLGTGDNLAAQGPRAVSVAVALQGRSVFGLSAGGDNTCVIAGVGADRLAYCWGENALAQLGNNTQGGSSNQPVAVAMTGPVSSLSVDESGGCAIVGGATRCWGDNTQGRLGNGNTFLSKFPVPVTQTGVLSTRRELSVSAGRGHSAAVAGTTVVFADAPTNVTFYDDIAWIAGTGTSTGYPDDTYHPLDTIERQAMAAFLFRFVHPGSPDPKCAGTERLFVDVPKSSAFCGAIEWLVDAGVTTVPANHKFTPVGGTTRSVLAAWMFRTVHPFTADRACAGGTFMDVSAETGQCGNIEWLAAAGVTTGYPDGTFHPTDVVRRDAMAAFFHRAEELTTH